MQTKISAKRHRNVTKIISKQLDFNENGHELISRFKEVKDYLDTYSATKRQKLFVCLNLETSLHTPITLSQCQSRQSGQYWCCLSAALQNKKTF